ncbi:MAG: hypothetical protein ACYTXY_49905, partial [Nostoc sp.]
PLQNLITVFSTRGSANVALASPRTSADWLTLRATSARERHYELRITNYLMGVEGLEPTRPFRVNGFSFFRSFHCYLIAIASLGFKNWTLPLPST